MTTTIDDVVHLIDDRDADIGRLFAVAVAAIRQLLGELRDGILFCGEERLVATRHEGNAVAAHGDVEHRLEEVSPLLELENQRRPDALKRRCIQLVVFAVLRFDGGELLAIENGQVDAGRNRLFQQRVFDISCR